jgi:SPP1 family predicted phage head-tail adaptor
MDLRATIEQRTQADDGAGGKTDTWTTLAQVWVEDQPDDAFEESEAGQVNAIRRGRLVLRYRSDITLKHRVKLEGRVLNIRGILPARRAGEMMILYSEEPAQ